MSNVKQISNLEKACIDFYFHNDSQQICKENLMDLLSLAISSEELNNYTALERSSLMWTFKHLQKLIDTIYNMPIEKNRHISDIYDGVLKMNANGSN